VYIFQLGRYVGRRHSGEWLDGEKLRDRDFQNERCMYQHQGDKVKEDEQAGTRSTHGEMETFSPKILRLLTT
jgi:hypothetical protein